MHIFCISIFHLNHLLLYFNPLPIALTFLVVDILAKSSLIVLIKLGSVNN